MKFIADLHIHSKYSRATSRDMDLEHISEYAKLKGIRLMGTGDFTHHLWLEELKQKLKPNGKGLFEFSGVNFILTAEVSNIYSHDVRGRRVHNIIFAPDFSVVDKINRALAKYGNLGADGRPMLGLECPHLLDIIKEINPDCLIIPAHAWTPWYSIFGANSGFDSIEECFGEYSSDIYAIETGLSSDPAMNWRLSRLDKITLISNSDAHSPAKIGREANVFDLPLDYAEIARAIKTKDNKSLLFTLELFPEEGKYHFDGHRNCKVTFSPEESQQH